MSEAEPQNDNNESSQGKLAATMSQAKLYDAGFHTVNWQLQNASALPSHSLSAIDLKALLDSPEATELIPKLPPQFLYLAIKEQRLESHHQLLAHITNEQFTALLDFDIWTGDRVDTTKMSLWLAQVARLGPKELLTKFRDLEEEYQLAYVLGRVDLFAEEDLEALPEEIEQQLIAMPDQKLYYRVKNASDDEVEVVKSVIDAALIHHPEYAYSLLNHGAFMPPEETEHQLFQFRTARLEEHGFVSFAESLELLNTKGLSHYYDDCRKRYAPKDSAAPAPHTGLTPFLAAVTEAMYRGGSWQPHDIFAWHQKLLWVVNGLSTANRVPCYDLKGLKKTMMQVKGVLGLALDTICHGNVTMALDVLKNENTKTLFRYGLAVVEPVQNALWASLKNHPGFDQDGKLSTFRAKGQTGVLLQKLEAVAGSWFDFEDQKTLLGFFNKIPMVKITMGEKLSFEPIASANHFYLMVKDATLLAFRHRYGTAVSRGALTADFMAYRKVVHSGLARIASRHADQSPAERAGSPLSPAEFAAFAALPAEEREQRLATNLRQYIEALAESAHLAPEVYGLSAKDAEDALRTLWLPVISPAPTADDFWLER